MDLKKIRNEVSHVDEKILRLLVERANLTTKIAALKLNKKDQIRDPKRESELIKKLKGQGLRLGLASKDIQKIWEVIIGASRSSQKNCFQIAEKLRLKKLVYREKKIKTKLGITEIFARLRQNFPTTFLLESLGEDANFSRKSYLGFDPHAVIQGEPGKLIVSGSEFPTPNPYEALKLFLPKFPRGKGGFRGGLFGYICYEATRYFEPAVDFKKHPDFPDFEFGLYYDGLIFDKKTKEFKYFYLNKDRSQLLKNILWKPLKREPKFKATSKGHNLTRDYFEKNVSKAKEEIFKGNTFQFQFGRKSYFDLSGNRMEFYETLREVNPSPHMFYLQFGGTTNQKEHLKNSGGPALRSPERAERSRRELIGSSPELIVRVENGVVENYPLAGTRKRTGEKKQDDKLAKELLADEKERAEHMMLVDLGRNDVGRISKFGSVKVSKLMQIKRFSHVQHIGSEIIGKLRPGLTAFDALATNTPVGTVSGAPKVETMKIIERIEKDARGPYAGAIGFFSLTGDCVFAANLRSLYASGKRATVQASAGIVADSVPEFEYKEVEKKVRGIIAALEKASK